MRHIIILFIILFAIQVKAQIVDPCINVAKPIFNTTNFSFCYGDSLKLSIENINNTDSIKWYYGVRKDESNKFVKYFYDSTKVFVLRKDKNGCTISSDTIQLNIKDQPEFRIVGNKSLAFDKDSSFLYIVHESNTKNGNWYFNNNFISSNDSLFVKEIGEYKYVQKGENGCSRTEIFTLVKDPQVTFKLNTYYFDIKENSVGGVGVTNAPSVIIYNADGIEHIIHTLATNEVNGAPALHFIKKNNSWLYEGIYPEGAMSGGSRNFSLINNKGDIAIATHGTEAVQPWPYGDIFTVKTIGDKLKFNKISNEKSFYHSVAAGDMNNDGLSDVFGIHMGTYSNWKRSIHAYISNSDQSYKEDRNILDVSNIVDNYQKDYGSALLIDDFDSDKMNELIKASSGWDRNGYKFSFLQFKFDSTSNSIKYYNQPDQLGIFRDGQKGSTSLKSADVDMDNDKDIIVAIEGHPGGGIQIWLNDGKGNFSPGQIIYTYQDEYGFREFELADINNDGQIDLLLHPNGSGNKFRINPRPHNIQTNPWGYLGDGIKLESSIYLNRNGIFNPLNANIILPDLHPDFMKGFYSNNKLKFIGFEDNSINNNSNYSNFNLFDFYIYEVEINFCNNLKKPIFNTNDFSFCSSDSLQLSITNLNEGDTIKWYFNNELDSNFVANKIITKPLNLYVTKTDSLGCIISSDTINITKYPEIKNSFTINAAAQCLASNNFAFTNTSTISSGTLTHTWTFSDGGSATTANASKTYAAAGNYTVKLVSTSNFGCRDSITQQVVINPMPVATFTANTNSQCLSGNNFAFTNTSTISSGNLTHVWSFGDGTNATSQNSARTYASAGLFDVKLITTSNAGCKDSINRQITVHPMPAVSLSINNAAQCLASNNFAFTNTSTISSGTLTHAWSFGDGASATTANASRAYAAVGNYDVKLVTTSSFGCRDSVIRQVTVHPMPTKPGINWDGINLSTVSTYASYQWLLNNSAVAGANAAEHKPVNPGSYRVRITNTPGCADTSDAFNLVVTAAGRVTQNQNKVAIYPNPATSSVFIDLGKSPSQPVSVQLLTIEGRPMTNWIMQQQRQEFEIDHIQNGTYLIQIIEGKTKTIHKVVIQTP